MKYTKLDNLLYFVLPVGGQDSGIKLLGAVSPTGEYLVARPSLQGVLKVDFSKRYGSRVSEHFEIGVRKGDSKGVLNDGRKIVFITVQLAAEIAADKHYLKALPETRHALLECLRAFAPKGVENAQAHQNIEPKTQEPEAPKTIADKKLEDYVRPPSSPADTQAARAAVEAAVGELGFPETYELKASNAHCVKGGGTLRFNGKLHLVVVLQDPVSWKLTAYTKFSVLCKAIGLDAEQAMMGISYILDTGYARDWGMHMADISIAGLFGIGPEGSSRGPWIDLDSIASWLSTFEAYVRKAGITVDCSANRAAMDLYQTAFKEAAMKFIQPIMLGVCPKADSNTAGVKPPLVADKPEAFDKAKFIAECKTLKAKAPEVPNAEAAEVLDTKVVPMEDVLQAASAQYATRAAEAIKSAEGTMTPIEAVLLSDSVQRSLVTEPKPKLPPKAGEAAVAPGTAIKDDKDLDEPFLKSAVAEPEAGYVELDRFKTFDFHADTLGYIMLDDVCHVSIRGICKALGLDFASQSVKLHGDSRFSCCAITTRNSRGARVPMLCLRLEHLAAWLFTVNVNKVAPEVRPKLEFYQKDLVIALDNYVRKGAAFNTAKLGEAITLKMVEVLQRLTDRMTGMENRYLESLDAKDREIVEVADRAVAIVNPLVDKVNEASVELDRTRRDLEDKKQLAAQKTQEAAQKSAEARIANELAGQALRAKDQAEATMNQVISDAGPREAKLRDLEEIVNSGPAKNAGTIAHELGLVSATALNHILQELGFIVKNVRYSNTWEPSAKMMRLAPLVPLGCIELAGKGKAASVPVFGHTTVVHNWVWLPAGEAIIKRAVKQWLAAALATQAAEDAKKDVPDLFESAAPIPGVSCEGPKLQSRPPGDFPGAQCSGGRMP